jgi:uncharacterized membrane protein YwaF
MKVLVAWTLMVAYLGFAAVSAGLQTNWFRYPASVEAWAVLVPLALSTAAVIVFNVFFLRRNPVLLSSLVRIVSSLRYRGNRG